jgi:cystathionine beta-synthase
MERGLDPDSTILESVGDTPLVRLRRLPRPGSAAVYCKCEYLNPSGSVKDRFVFHALDRALERGEIAPGGTVVENTSGNTGAALALWAAVKGIRCIFTIPDKMSSEKINTLKALGADVVVCPTSVPADSPESYYETAKRIARETGGFYLNQYHNVANAEAHYATTGPEIWRQSGGQLDYFVAGLGTGGTMSGAGRYLKEQKPALVNVGVDPVGSVFYSLFKTGQLSQPEVYKVEGIGEDMQCGALDFSVIDDIRQVGDRESFLTARRLAREEGLFAGGASGSAVHVALELAREVGPRSNIVVVLTDGGRSYISKFYSEDWMVDNGFLPRPVSGGTALAVLQAKGDRALYTARQGQPVCQVVGELKTRGVSQLPVLSDAGEPLGMVHESDLLEGLVEGRLKATDPIDVALQPLDGVVGPEAPLSEMQAILREDLAVVVKDGDHIAGLLTKIDLIDYISKQVSL